MTSVSSIPADEEASNVKVEPIKVRLQKKLFGIFNEVMKDRNIRFHVGVVLVPLVFLQMIGYAYDRSINFPFKDKFFTITSLLLNYLRIVPALEQAHNKSIYWLLLYSIIALIVIVFLLMVYVDYSNKIGKFVVSFPLSLLIALCVVFYWIILTPAVEGFVGIYLCKNGKHLIVNTMNCWSVEHIIYCIVFTLACMAFILIIALIAFFNNESRSESLDIFSRTDSNLEIYFAAYRILIAIVSPFCRTSNLQWVLIILYLVGAAALVRNYFLYLPYHNRQMSVLYGAGVVSYLWVAINLLLLKLLEKVQYTGQTVVIIVGLVVIYPLVNSIRDKIIYSKIFNCRHDKISNEYELDIYMSKLKEMATSQQLSEVDEMILLGYVTNHKAECANPECPLNNDKEFYLPIVDKSISSNKAAIKDPIILAHLLNSIYSEYSQHTNSTATLHVVYSYYLFYKMGNIHLALMELNLACKCDNSLQQSFSIYRMKKIIEESLSSKHKGANNNDSEIRNLDVNIVIVFEGMLQEFQKAIEKSTSEHIEFWAHLDTLLPDLNHLHKLGLNIIKYSKQTHDLWNKLCKINPAYPSALRIYGTYLKDIKNDEEVGAKLLDKEKNIKNSLVNQENLNDFEIMFAENTAIIVISGVKETQGKITKSNAGVVKIFGYNPKDLIGHDCSIIMPPIIGAQHSKFLNRYFTTGKEIILNREKLIYGMHRGHYIMPICLIVKPISVVEDDISYIALIRSINKNFDYIITDVDGKIDSMTNRVIGNFGVSTSSFFQDNEVYIHLIFPDLMTKVKMPDGKMITRFDAMINGDSMRIAMSIPKDFIQAVQLLNKYEKETDAPTKDAHPEDPQELKKSINYQRFEESLKFHSKAADSINLLKSFMEYKDSEYFERVKINLIEEVLGEGIMRMKIFKITHESKVEQGSSRGSEAESFSEIDNAPTKKDVQKKDGLKPSINESILDESMMEISSKSPKTGYIEIEDPLVMVKQPEKQTDVKPPENMEHEQSNIKMGGAIGDLSAADLSLLTGSNANQSTELQNKLISKKSNKKKKDEEDLKEVDGIFLHSNIKAAEGKEKEANDDLLKKKTEERASKLNSAEISSMISNTKDTLKKIKQLRAAMYEKYEPSSVKQLKITAQIVFLILVTLTLAFFFVQKNLLSSCQSSILSIYESKDRIVSITGIAYSTRMLSYDGVSLNFSVRDPFSFGSITYNDSKLSYLEWTLKNIGTYASLLKESQNNLSTTAAIIDSKMIQSINPNDVTIYFPKAEQGIPKYVSIDCWSSIMSLVGHAHNIEQLNLTYFSDPLNYPESVDYVMNNAMDSVLLSVNGSTDAILKEIKLKLVFNDMIFKILLSVASASLLASILILFPVAYKVARNKGHLLSLFMDINPKSVREQLKKCRNSFNSIRLDNSDKPQGDEMDDDDEDKKDEKKDEQDLLVDGERILKRTKNFKKYTTKFFYTVIKFTCFVLFLEFYFIFSYFSSNTFFIKISHISDEVCLIAKRTYSNSLLYRAEIEMIGDNGKTSVLNMTSQEFIGKFTEDLIQQQEQFLKIHSQNLKYNDPAYNKEFDRIVYNSVCEAVYNNDSACISFMGGILQKGLYSANVAFWDNMREFYGLYKANDSKLQLNNKQLIENEILESNYFYTSYNSLQGSLNDSIQNRFSSQKSVGLIVFLTYICIMIMVYYIYWRLFLESTRTSLWVTKSMLAIIPLEVVEKVKSINSFLKNTTISSLG